MQNIQETKWKKQFCKNKCCKEYISTCQLGFAVQSDSASVIGLEHSHASVKETAIYLEESDFCNIKNLAEAIENTLKTLLKAVESMCMHMKQKLVKLQLR